MNYLKRDAKKKKKTKKKNTNGRATRKVFPHWSQKQ